jgi:hypothetical protein
LCPAAPRAAGRPVYLDGRRVDAAFTIVLRVLPDALVVVV